MDHSVPRNKMLDNGPAPAGYDVKAGLVEVNAFDVVGISVVTKNDNERAVSDINTLWERFFSERVAHHVPARADDVIYAVYSDYEGDHTAPYRLTIGYRVERGSVFANAPISLHRVTVCDGDYAVMSAAGQQPQALLGAWEAIWSSDLDRSFATDFEVYGSRFFEEGLHEVLVHVGVHIPKT